MYTCHTGGSRVCRKMSDSSALSVQPCSRNAWGGVWGGAGFLRSVSQALITKPCYCLFRRSRVCGPPAPPATAWCECMHIYTYVLVPCRLPAP